MVTSVVHPCMHQSHLRSYFLLFGTLQNKEYKLLNEQLSMLTSAHSSEVEKLKKELLRYEQSHQGDGNQLVSLQEEMEHLRLELEKAHGERKVMEDSYVKEKDLLRKVGLSVTSCVGLLQVVVLVKAHSLGLKGKVLGL